MKQTITLLIAILFSGILVAQEDPAAPVKNWKHSGIYNLGVTQTSLTNWAAGGNNNTNATFLLKQAATFNKNKSTWFNLFELNFGYNFQPGRDVKTDDKIEYTTRYDRQIKDGNWSGSFFGNFKTQLVEGYADPEDKNKISDWLSPGYATYGFGFTNKGVEGLTVYISPVTVKQTFVLDDSLSSAGTFFAPDAPNVGTLASGTFRTEMGAYLDIMYAKQVTKSFEVATKLNFFSNYLDRPENIDVNWEGLFLFKANKWLTASLLLNLIYDHDILVQDTNEDGDLNAPGVQFKQVLGVGLSYSFGEFKE